MHSCGCLHVRKVRSDAVHIAGHTIACRPQGLGNASLRYLNQYSTEVHIVSAAQNTFLSLWARIQCLQSERPMKPAVAEVTTRRHLSRSWVVVLSSRSSQMQPSIVFHISSRVLLEGLLAWSISKFITLDFKLEAHNRALSISSLISTRFINQLSLPWFVSSVGSQSQYLGQHSSVPRHYHEGRSAESAEPPWGQPRHFLSSTPDSSLHPFPAVKRGS
jgi:hypothetical protein